MGRQDKLLQRVLLGDSDRNIAFDELRALLCGSDSKGGYAAVILEFEFFREALAFLHRTPLPGHYPLVWVSGKSGVPQVLEIFQVV